MNRQQRRAQKKIKRPSYRGLTPEEKKEQLFKNGITMDDLSKEYKAGFDDGFRKAAPYLTKTIYAAAALAARECYGFGLKRVKRLLASLDNHVVNTLLDEEIIEKVWQEIGLHLDFNDPMEPIKED